MSATGALPPLASRHVKWEASGIPGAWISPDFFVVLVGAARAAPSRRVVGAAIGIHVTVCAKAAFGTVVGFAVFHMLPFAYATLFVNVHQYFVTKLEVAGRCWRCKGGYTRHCGCGCAQDGDYAYTK